MASKVTEFIQSSPITDPKTGNPTQTFLQKINALLGVGYQALNGLVSAATDAQVRAGTGSGYVQSSSLQSAAASVALTDAATVAVDWATGINFSLTVAGNRAIGNPTNEMPGTYRSIVVKGNDGTARTITFGSEFGGEVPTITDCTSTKWYKIVIDCVATSHFVASAYDVSPP